MGCGVRVGWEGMTTGGGGAGDGGNFFGVALSVFVVPALPAMMIFISAPCLVFLLHYV